MLLIGLPRRGPDGQPYERTERALRRLAPGYELSDAIATFGVSRLDPPSKAPPPSKVAPQRQSGIQQAQAKLDNVKRVLADDSGRWATALHEAGHAVICVRQGIRFGTVSILPDQKADGMVTSISCIDRERNPRGTVLVAMAGAIAASRAVPQGDIRAQMSQADKNIMAAELPLLNATRDELHREAEQTVWRNWHAIDAVARELVLKGWLDNEAVAKVVRLHG